MAPKTRSRGKAPEPQTDVRKQVVRLSRRAKNADEKKWIRGYKLTYCDGKSFKGRPRIKYEAGQTYEAKGEIKICKNGLHFSGTALDAWARSGAMTTFASQLALWEVKSEEDKTETTAGKMVTSSLTVERKISSRYDFNVLMSGWVHLSPILSKYVLNGAALATCGVQRTDGAVSISLARDRIVRKIEIETKLDPVGELMRYARDLINSYVASVEAEIGQVCEPLDYNSDCLNWVLIEDGIILMRYCTPFDNDHKNLMIRESGGSSMSHCPNLGAACEIAKGRFPVSRRAEVAAKLRKAEDLTVKLRIEASAMRAAAKREAEAEFANEMEIDE